MTELDFNWLELVSDSLRLVQVPRNKLITLTIELNRVGWWVYLAALVMASSACRQKVGCRRNSPRAKNTLATFSFNPFWVWAWNCWFKDCNKKWLQFSTYKLNFKALRKCWVGKLPNLSLYYKILEQSSRKSQVKFSGWVFWDGIFAAISKTNTLVLLYWK